jgi:hypothetical protein
MIVDNLNIMSVITHPPEANAPLIVDPDAYLAGALALEHFEPVSRWDLQILDRPRCIHLAQLSQGPILDLGRELPAQLALPDALCLPTIERQDHPKVLI